MPLPRILVTGFEPFDGAPANSSGDAVRDLADGWSGPEPLETLILPVEFDRAAELLLAALAARPADVVIATGLAQGRTAITPERIAVNVQDARIPDNAGAQPRERPVVAGAPDGLFTGLPLAATLAALERAGIPGRASGTAGEYVCNDVFYRLRQHDPSLVSGFVHLPATPACGFGPEVPVLELAELARGLEVVVRAAIAAAGGRASVAERTS